MRARRARTTDAAAIHALIAHYVAEGLLLPRSDADIREHASRFLVLQENDVIVGCVSLKPYGADLAEIRSLAVNPEIRGQGLGAKLVQAALAEARRKKIARVFAVTHAPGFFVHQGFASSSRQAVPEKIERDCNACPKKRRCRLIAVVFAVCPERVTLPLLAASASPAPAV